MHARSFRVSVSHLTLTWTTGSLTCVRDCFFVRAHTHGGWAHRQRVSTTFLTRKNTHFSCAPDRIRTSVLWILTPTLYQLGHPVTPDYMLYMFVKASHTECNFLSIICQRLWKIYMNECVFCFGFCVVYVHFCSCIC